MPPPQKKLHREAKRKIEGKPDERLKSARRALSSIFASVPCPQTPEPPKRIVRHMSLILFSVLVIAPRVLWS